MIGRLPMGSENKLATGIIEQMAQRREHFHRRVETLSPVKATVS